MLAKIIATVKNAVINLAGMIGDAIRCLVAPAKSATAAVAGAAPRCRPFEGRAARGERAPAPATDRGSTAGREAGVGRHPQVPDGHSREVERVVAPCAPPGQT